VSSEITPTPAPARFLEQVCQLLPRGARVVVGASGGPDSTALLACLRAVAGELSLSLVAAHLDHGLRDEEAARDQQAASDLAERLGVPFRAGRADAQAELARRPEGSLEAAARAVRYRFLLETARSEGAGYVAVGHTADDQAETVLGRVLRGTGLRGLGGMPACRTLGDTTAETVGPAVLLVRPLLEVTRAEAREVCQRMGLPWVVDSSNADTRFARVRLRERVLPVLRAAANPRVEDALLRLAEQARRAGDLLDRLARAALADAACGPGWRADQLQACDPAVRAEALALLVAQAAPDRAAAAHVHALERLLEGGRGAVDLPGAQARVADGLLLLSGTAERAGPAADDVDPPPALVLPVPGCVVDTGARLELTARQVPRLGLSCQTDPRSLVRLDAARAAGRLAVRRRRSGDRFWPLGAPGTRTLKRFLIDRKVPQEGRDSIPVVTLDDAPLWVVGHRIDDRYKVTPTTEVVLELRARVLDAQKETDCD
jgi:tRNA(Ile)-lysidine synthase